MYFPLFPVCDSRSVFEVKAVTNIHEFRDQINRWWAETDAEQIAKKHSHAALLKLIALYEGLSHTDRMLADQVLIEWVTSENNRKRFDALAMVERFKIAEAIPALRKLESTLAEAPGAEATHELVRVREVLLRL